MFQKILLLALAGACGTVARYGLAMSVEKYNGASFPLGTLAVNVLGCFAVGMIWALFESKWPVEPQTRMLVLVGFMGAFTTFSAIMLESSELAKASGWLIASANVLVHNGLGAAALFGGAALIKAT